MKQSDLKKLVGMKFTYLNYPIIITVVKELDGSYSFHGMGGRWFAKNLKDVYLFVTGQYKSKVSSKMFDRVVHHKKQTMYDVLQKPGPDFEVADDGSITQIVKDYVTNINLPEDVKRDCAFAVAVMNDKEPKNDKIFLHSCHHLSSELKDVAVYMIKFMRICKKCSFNTYYTVMRDKFDRLTYEERNEVTYRLLQDKVIMTLDSMYGDKCYQYTPERVKA